MSTSVVQVAEGGVTFKFYYPDTTTTTTPSSPSPTEDPDVTTRRLTTGPYHQAAASQSPHEPMTTTMPTTLASDTDNTLSASGYVPGVVFSEYVLNSTSTTVQTNILKTNISSVNNNDSDIVSRPVDIVGIMIGVVVFIVLTVLGGFFYRRRRQRMRRNGVILEKQSRRGASGSTSMDIDMHSPNGTLPRSGTFSSRNEGQPFDLTEIVTSFPSTMDLTSPGGGGTISSHGGTGTWQSLSSLHLLGTAGGADSRGTSIRPTRQGTMSTMGAHPLLMEESDRASISLVGGEITPFPFASAPPYSLEVTPRLDPAGGLVDMDIDGHPIDHLILPPPPAYTLPGTIHDRLEQHDRPLSRSTIRGSIYSSEVDEDDALAVDGSSLARTLTTESSDGTIISDWTESGASPSARHHAARRAITPVAWGSRPLARLTNEGRGAVRVRTSMESLELTRRGEREVDAGEQQSISRGLSNVGSTGEQRTEDTMISSTSQSPSTLFGTQAGESTGYTSATSAIPTDPSYPAGINPDPFADPQSRDVDRNVAHTKPPNAPIVRWSSRSSTRSTGTSARSFIAGDDASSNILPLGNRWQ